jgi:hypothetical protein
MGRQPSTSYDAAVAPDPTQLIDRSRYPIDDLADRCTVALGDAGHEGRRSLHRVTPIAGSTPRLVALLAYDTKPGTCSSELLRLVRYGRATARSN